MRIKMQARDILLTNKLIFLNRFCLKRYSPSNQRLKMPHTHFHLIHFAKNLHFNLII